MKDSEKKRFKITIAILIFLILITIGLNIFLNLDRPLFVVEKDVAFIIGDDYGLKKDTQMLDFGKVPPGSGVEKFINIENQYQHDVRIEVMLSKGIKDHLFGKKSFTLGPGEKKSYSISLKPPISAKKGNYSGTISFAAHAIKTP